MERILLIGLAQNELPILPNIAKFSQDALTIAMEDLNPLAEAILLQPLRLYQMIYHCICICMYLGSIALFRSTRSSGGHAYQSRLSPHFLITFILYRKRTLKHSTIIVAAQWLLKADFFRA